MLSHALNIFKKTVIYGFFNSISKLVPFLLLPVLTRYLSSEDYAIITLINIFILFLGAIFRLEVHAALKREYIEHKYDFAEYVSSSLVVPIFVLIILLIIFILCYPFLPEFLGVPRLWILICLVISFGAAFSTYLSALYQIMDKAVSTGLWEILISVPVFLGTFILIVFFNFDWQGRIWPILATSVFIQIPLSLYLIYRIVPYKLVFDLNKMLELLKFSMPLVPMTISIYILQVADRIFITEMIGLETAGLYAVSGQLAAVMSLAYNSFMPTWEAFTLEKLKESRMEKFKEIGFVFTLFLVVMIIASLFVILIFPHIMPYILGKAFFGSENYLIWLVAGESMRGIYHALLPFIYHLRKTKVIMYLNFFLVILYVLLNYILILTNGAIGAAQANLLVHIIGFCILFLYLFSKYRKPFISL